MLHSRFVRHPRGNAGDRSVGLRNDDQIGAAVGVLPDDEHRLAIPRMERIVDPPLDRVFVGSLSLFRAGPAPRAYRRRSPGALSHSCGAECAKSRGVLVGPPQRAQIIEHRLRQRHAPLCVALPDDAQEQIGLVDRADLERRGLAEAQAASVHDGEAGLVDRVPYAAKQVADLRIGERDGQALLPRLANLFLENSGHSRSSVWR
jgi:hypothetical protein